MVRVEAQHDRIEGADKVSRLLRQLSTAEAAKGFVVARGPVDYLQKVKSTAGGEFNVEAREGDVEDFSLAIGVFDHPRTGEIGTVGGAVGKWEGKDA